MRVVRLPTGPELSFWDQGPGVDEAVVFLPGPTDGWRSYLPVLSTMPDDMRVVAVSLRGHGESSKPSTGYRIEDLATDIVPFLDALAIAQAVLVGHSGSCLVARRVGLQAAGRVAGLFLEASPTTLRGDEGLQGFVDSVVSTLTDPIDRDVARSFLADTSSEGLDPDVLEFLVDDVVAVPIPAWREMFGSLLDYDDTAELGRLRMPVSLVWGDADPLVSKSAQDELVRLLPHAELTVYEGVGHTPRWEQPDRFAQDLTAFARRLLR